MALPHADEIRALRAQAERGTTARARLVEVETALTGLALGAGPDTVVHLLTSLAQDWPDPDGDADPSQALHRARGILQQAAADGAVASRALHEKLESQWELLSDPQWKSVRAELEALAGQRTGLSASLAPIQQALRGLQPLPPVVRDQLAAARLDLARDDAIATVRAQQRLASLVTAITPMLDRASLGPEIQDVPGEPSAAIERVEQISKKIQAAIEQLQAEWSRISTELEQIEARIVTHTG